MTIRTGNASDLRGDIRVVPMVRIRAYRVRDVGDGITLHCVDLLVLPAQNDHYDPPGAGATVSLPSVFTVYTVDAMCSKRSS